MPTAVAVAVVLALIAGSAVTEAACPHDHGSCGTRLSSCTPAGGSCLQQRCLDKEGKEIQCVFTQVSPRQVHLFVSRTSISHDCARVMCNLQPLTPCTINSTCMVVRGLLISVFTGRAATASQGPPCFHFTQSSSALRQKAAAICRSGELLGWSRRCRLPKADQHSRCCISACQFLWC